MTARLSVERAEQRRWRLRPRFAGTTAFDTLLENEFLPPEVQCRSRDEALRNLVGFAAAQVPYYADLLLGAGVDARDIRGAADLPSLPSLSRNTVHENSARLQAKALPPGHLAAGSTQSSGTTGRPTSILHTVQSRGMFALLKQREMRWFRFDPQGIFASIRIASQLPRCADGMPLQDGETCCLPSWPLVGDYFETGPFFGYGITNPLNSQREWLERHRPQYLLSYSESLEHLAFACQQCRPPDSLRGLHAISEQLTPDMRLRIERTFGVPISQNYGLNEVGIVASRCPEGGRYHVHAEHCLVEIVDECGGPCRGGQVGRMLVTGLTNFAMPLVRYDTDDLAEAVDGPCRCGRTLPSFGEVVGRYSRIAFLPEGTLGHVAAVREALAQMPPEFSRDLRQFQVHQYRDLSFEMRVVTVNALPSGFTERIQQAWRAAVSPHHISLRITNVDRIPRSEGGKFQDFTSDFMPPPSSAPGSATVGQPAGA